ncbi:hypothetical protein [Rhizobium sp. NXC24]|uniref:hypothetical protein n=1 Tax=Rhizobium sp. NXC24 TaxID=2048897 RepID=UPI000CF28816|nr:hypothetical protein [Rhizobium sp. NXC24]
MISPEFPLPTIGEMYAAALDHNRLDLIQKTFEMEQALESFLSPAPSLTIDGAANVCISAASLWAEVSGIAWAQDIASIAGFLNQRYQLIFGEQAA